MAIKKSELYSSLWASCDELRGGMDASQYKDYVLVMLFIKYISDKYAGVPYSPITVPKGSSFKDMATLKGKPTIGDDINKKILGPIGEANKISDFPDFNDVNKLGSGQEMVKRLSNLIAIFENPGLDFSKNKADGDDILGDAYEYLMRHFATESGKSKGQFYTPAEVSRVMAKIIGINSKNTTSSTTVYDPTCGSGSLLLKVADESEKSISIYGQEMDVATSSLARMNMILHDNPTAEIKQGNTLANPLFLDKNGRLRTFDFVVANPPFSFKSWSNGVDAINDPFGRFHYGIPPSKNGDYAFLLHIVRSLKSTGKGAIILPHGVLFRGNAEAEIRTNLIRAGLIKGLIGLPPNLFYGTGIPACIILIDKEHAASRKSIFIVDASKGFMKDGNKNRLREQDIHKIVDVFNNQVELEKYSRIVPVKEIQEKEYNLNIPRYIDSQEPEEVFAKYLNPDPEENPENADLTQLFMGLANVFSLNPTGGPGLEGQQAYNAIADLFPSAPYLGAVDFEDVNAPKAFLNYILFNENFELINFGFDQIDMDAMQERDLNPVSQHDYLSLHLKVTEKGFLYIYVSNENPTKIDVYFDDFRIVHQSNIVQVADYYPFGQAIESQRFDQATLTPNSILFQGQEIQDELDLNYYQFAFRMHDPSIGRFISSDPLADSYVYNSPYAFAENRVVDGIDWEGLEWRESTQEEIASYVAAGIQGQLGQPGFVQAIAGGAGGYYTFVGEHQFQTTCDATSGNECQEQITFDARAFGTLNSVVVLGVNGSVQEFGANEFNMVELPHSNLDGSPENCMRPGQYSIDGQTLYRIYNYETDDQYGTSENIAAFINSAVAYKEFTGGLVNYGDFSDSRGNTFDPHHTHANGTQGDWRYPNGGADFSQTSMPNFNPTESNIARVQAYLQVAYSHGMRTFYLARNLAGHVRNPANGAIVERGGTFNGVRFGFNVTHDTHGHAGR